MLRRRNRDWIEVLQESAHFVRIVAACIIIGRSLLRLYVYMAQVPNEQARLLPLGTLYVPRSDKILLQSIPGQGVALSPTPIDKDLVDSIWHEYVCTLVLPCFVLIKVDLLYLAVAGTHQQRLRLRSLP